jgi:predicted phosphoadenosine phosphosulfate sulfurtransferase
MAYRTKEKVKRYIELWSLRGYPEDIPDEVPEVLMNLGKAPSYKAICIAILRNDLELLSLGFTPRKSQYYNELKRLEIERRSK